MKARLKTIVLSALGALAAFSAVTSTSCKEDKCKAIVCAYGGVCKEGTCICQAGYEGYQCETITAEKYEGVWTVFENGTTTNSAQYDVTISYGANMTEMNITNFYNKFTSPVAARIKSDTLFIPQQTIQGYTVQGVGYLVDNKYYGKERTLEVRYTVNLPDGRVDDFGVNGVGDVSLWHTSDK